MKQKIRTFVAVPIDAEVRDSAAELIDQLRSISADVKWVDPENLHFTLKFLGDVPAQEIHQICRTVQEAVAETPRFELDLVGTGAFPNARRPRTIWLGTGRGQQEMAAMAERIESALETLGYRREARRFHAHLTLGRVRRAGPVIAELGRLIQEYAQFDVGTSRVERVTVFSSTLSRTGSTYEALAQAPLAPIDFDSQIG